MVGIVETKAPGVKRGLEQCSSYISAVATCRWGAWTNGEEIKCARREDDGSITFDPAYSIPKFGEGFGVRICSFGELTPASNLKLLFKYINNRLYANTNIPRSELQGAEMVRLIFCKLTDEYSSRDNPNKTPEFQVFQNEKPNDLRKRINKLWERTKSSRYGASIFLDHEKIMIDDYSLQLIVSLLQSHSLLATNSDVVGQAFEVFSEKQFAGEKGQFFTPRLVVKMMVDMIDPKEDETILDPACGSGGFLIATLDHISVGKSEIEKRDIAEHCLFGIDKDSDLSKICKAHMSIIGDGKSNIVTADSLGVPSNWNDDVRSKFCHDDGIKEFDVILTNPPFGSKIKVDREEVLEQYELASANNGCPPQILFIERCMEFLKPGGRMGIVLPDGVLGNPREEHVRNWLLGKAELLAVVDCPVNTFMPHTGTKTSVLILRKFDESDTRLPFFAIAEHCGHTSRGEEIVDHGKVKEDFSEIARNYKKRKSSERKHLGFIPNSIQETILLPKYYDPRILAEIKAMEQQGGVKFVRLGDLIDDGSVDCFGAGASVKQEHYSLHGEIRFIRTSDVSGYELSDTTQKMVPIEIFEEYRQPLQTYDILFVKDGDTKIGQTVILTCEEDLRILVQTHFHILRPVKINPWLLLTLLNTKIVKKQIRQRVFIQSTLGTIGKRIKDLRLPLPLEKKKQKIMSSSMKRLILKRRDDLQEIRRLVDS